MATIFEKGMHAFEANKTVFEKAYIERAKGFNWDKAALEYADVYRSLL